MVFNWFRRQFNNSNPAEDEASALPVEIVADAELAAAIQLEQSLTEEVETIEAAIAPVTETSRQQ
jgi:hypothetical protein